MNAACGPVIGKSATEVVPAVLEHTECLICGSDVIRRSKRSPAWVARCQSCGLAFASPQPADEELAAIYDAGYFAHFGYTAGHATAFRRMKQAWFERLLEVAEQFIRPGRLLDIGSGLGDLLTVARARDWQGVGVETNAYAVAEAERVVPGAIFAGPLAVLPAMRNSFDLVTCTDVLEHLRRPDVELIRMRERLRPGGWLLITTIDIGSWTARLLGASWPHFHRDHLWYFSRETLTRLVEQSGFDLVHWKAPRKTFNLRYLLGVLEQHAGPEWQRGAWCLVRKSLTARASAALLPGIREGQLLIARRREGDDLDS